MCNNLLEGITIITKSYCIKISQGKKDIGQRWEVPQVELPLSSVKSEHVTSLASACDNMRGLPPIREAQLDPKYRAFTETLPHRCD